MTASELRRKLKDLGCEFTERKKHTKVTYRGRTSVMPRHPPAEIRTGTYKAILKQLGIERL